LERTKLNGAAVEYAYRRFYPWELVAAVQYSQGQPLSQHLRTAEAGIGYCRGFKRWIPFGRVQVGAARTESNQEMYLYSAARTGVSFGLSAGVDYRPTPRIGIRAAQIQNQYLPFGSIGSVYWSFGAGINFRFKK
jgi:opacity protein-like surface antigen